MDIYFRLSTDQFAERDRIEAAREVIGRSLMRIDFELYADTPFNVDMTFRAQPGFAFAAGLCSAMDCVRTPALIDSDDLLLTFAQSGGATLHVRGEDVPIGQSMAALTRTSDVARCAIHTTSELVNFRFPFDKLSPLIADLDAAVMRPIPLNTEPMRLLMHYVSILKEEDMLMTTEVRSLVSSHLQDLTVLAIGATRDAAAVANGRGIPAARLRAIKADIVKNLTDRNLSIEAVALRHGISPRYIGMLFDGDATTFSEFVLVQRLERARRTLVEPRFADRTISSVAFEAGFGDLSYFNRTFRKRYGATPSDVRANSQI